MATCFVIQPFDEGTFDKRYEQIFAPAITHAGLTPYRVDQDAKVEIPIESIETGIRDAAICLADITTDNPNVWYELGFAMASGKAVVMACSTERIGKFPFDIQHRSVIRYKVEAPGDFANLQSKITAKIEALLAKGSTLRQIAMAGTVAPISGLSQPELTVLAALAGSVDTPESWQPTYEVKKEVVREFLTPLGFNFALRRLLQKKFVESGSDQDYNGNEYPALRVGDQGWTWMDNNESRFVISRPLAQASVPPEDYADTQITDDDIPF